MSNIKLFESKSVRSQYNEEESKWYNLIESKHLLEGHCKLNGIWEGFVNDIINRIDVLKDFFVCLFFLKISIVSPSFVSLSFKEILILVLYFSLSFFKSYFSGVSLTILK